MRIFVIATAAMAMVVPAVLAAEKEAEISHDGVSSMVTGGSVNVTNRFLDAALSLTRPQFKYLSLDSLGRGKFRTGALQRRPLPPPRGRPWGSTPLPAWNIAERALTLRRLPSGRSISTPRD